MKRHFELKSTLEKTIQSIDEMVNKIIDKEKFASHVKGDPKSGPSAEHIEEQLQLKKINSYAKNTLGRVRRGLRRSKRRMMRLLRGSVNGNLKGS